MSDEHIGLDRFKRYELSIQLRILEALYPDEATHYAVYREALEHGYEIVYDWMIGSIYDEDDSMSIAESKEVWDTLEMFDALNRVIRDSNDQKLSKHLFGRFAGYDGNTESKFMAFAAFTVERLERFQYLNLPQDGSWNSHMPTKDIYQRMMTKWKEIPRPKRYELSPENVEEILNASDYPASS